MRRVLPLGIRWTIGEVSELGFEALRFSAWGAYRLFGPRAAYAISVNSVPLERARRLTGDLPPGVTWHTSSREQLPRFLAERLDGAMAEGVAWKFAPPRLFPDRHELSLDNDCILWGRPRAMEAWLSERASFLLAEDVRPAFGQFGDLCGLTPLNSGIRGLPPGFDLEHAFQRILEGRPVTLRSELDEQGLQIAALRGAGRLHRVRVQEVTICSPFPPHLPYLGRCGAHFVGLNAKSFPWELDGLPAEVHIRRNWLRHCPTLRVRVRLPPVASAPERERSEKPPPAMEARR